MSSQDPLHVKDSYYLSQSGPNQMNSNIMRIRNESQGMQEPDYNYNINLGVMGVNINNPLLNSVNT